MVRSASWRRELNLLRLLVPIVIGARRIKEPRLLKTSQSHFTTEKDRVLTITAPLKIPPPFVGARAARQWDLWRAAD